MQKNIEILLQIQTLLLHLKDLDSEIASLPRRLAAVETKLSGTQQALQRVHASQAGNQSERRLAEREIDSLKAKIAKVRGHSADVKTNQEYKALLDEIAFAEAQIAKHEERLLQIMEEAEALDLQNREAQAALAAQQSEVAAETQTLAAETARDQLRRADLLQRGDALRAQVDDLWLRRFDRVLRMRGLAMAPIDREACSGCRVRQRPQFLQEMGNEPDRMFICESCGRILYLPPQNSRDEAPQPAPQAVEAAQS